MQSLYVMDLLLMTASILAITLMVWVDRVRFGTCLTPTAILGIPYMGIALMAFLTGPVQGYVPLYTPSVVIWMLFLGLFWATGQAVAAVFPDGALHVSAPLEEDRQLPLALAVAWMAIPVLIYGTYSALQAAGGFGGFREPEYRDVVFSGFAGHALMLSFPAFIYLVSILRKKVLIACGGTVAVLLVLMVLRPTKGWVLLPVTAALLCRMRSGRLRFSIRGISLAVLAMYGFYNISYLIAFGASDPESVVGSTVYFDLFRHAEDYLFSGVLSFSVQMQAGGQMLPNPAAAYAGFMNVGSLVSGGPLVSGIVEEFTLIRPGTGGFQSNVHTLFGTLLMSIGYFETSVYTIALGIVMHVVFLWSHRSNDMWVSAMWCFLAAGLAFAWFDTYFAQLALLEVPMYCVVLSMIGRVAFKSPAYRPLFGGEAANAGP